MRLALALLLPLALAACAPAPPPAQPHAFVGSWHCGARTIRFTNTAYDDGTATYRIRSVARDRTSYTLFLEGGSRIGLALVTETGLTRVSANSGEQVHCRRVN